MLDKKKRRSTWWLGTEVEHTEFFGLPTLFVKYADTLHSLMKSNKRAVSIDKVPHVYLLTTQTYFFTEKDGGVKLSLDAKIDRLMRDMRELIADEKKITIEVDASEFSRPISQLDFVNGFRIKYPGSVCVMIRIPVPKVELGGLAIKLDMVEDVKMANDKIYVATVADFQFNLVSDYAEDISGADIIAGDEEITQLEIDRGKAPKTARV